MERLVEQKTKEIWNIINQIKDKMDKETKDNIKDIPKEIIEFIEKGEYKDFDFNNFPKGSYVSHSWAGAQGDSIHGKFIVIRDGNIEIVDFENNEIEYSENGTYTGCENRNWYDNLKDGDTIIAIKLIKEEFDYNGYYDEQVDIILLKKPYIYMKINPDRAKKIRDKFIEWLDMMIENIRGE